ncbi:hypothetical protein K8O68_05570 [Salipaludibacillus sp. CUR1]|uniref:hypothetical protein n=1 Tax=Salipaludibacillus sp. CUR1 TaxID=2820003 RepID=UPI001E30BF2B|nr:hypothetical protein [Salipaludibacillus sp. CUR1]MCE7791888.1 hypothetical protein [Salipaludibacillus sp. CUR1]
MGIIPPQIFLEFDCSEVTPGQTLAATGASANLATVTLDVDESDNVVWLTAYASWTLTGGVIGNRQVTFSIVRDDDEVICSGTDTSGPVGSWRMSALTCCDENPGEGERTYTLVATAGTLGPAAQTVTFNNGTLTGSEIRQNG